MRVLRLVPPPAPDVSGEAKVRKRLRETKRKALPQCDTCAGREYVEARVGATKVRLCVACLMQGRRREMS
jgi:hypothetical protein